MTTVHQLVAAADMSNAPWATAMEGAVTEEERPGVTTVLDTWTNAAATLQAGAVPYNKASINAYPHATHDYVPATHGDVGATPNIDGTRGVIAAIRKRDKAVNNATFAAWALVMLPDGNKKLFLVPPGVPAPGYAAGGYPHDAAHGATGAMSGLASHRPDGLAEEIGVDTEAGWLPSTGVGLSEGQMIKFNHLTTQPTILVTSPLPPSGYSIMDEAAVTPAAQGSAGAGWQIGVVRADSRLHHIKNNRKWVARFRTPRSVHR